MNFSLTSDQAALQDSLRRFFSEKYTLEARRALVKRGVATDPTFWRAYAEMGWLAAALSEEMGGLGLGSVEAMIILQESGRAMVLEPVLPVLVAAFLLDRYAPDALKREVLPAIAEGRHIAVLAHAEPDRSAHLTAVGTRARRLEGEFVLDGSKCHVVGGRDANSLLVSALVASADAGSGSLALFKVDAGAVGLRWRNYTFMDGRQACDLVLDGVRVPAGACILENADEVLQSTLDYAAFATCAEAVGTMDAALALTSEYLKTRVQFGQPIGKFQALQHRMADMFIELEQARSMLYRGLAAMDGSTGRGRTLQVSAVKAQVGLAGRFVGGQAIQLHGGIGMTDEYGIGHCFRTLIVSDSLHGNAEAHLERMARALQQDAGVKSSTV